MNKAERMIITEKFEAVILAIPESGSTDKSAPYVLSKAVKAFRDVLKAL